MKSNIKTIILFWLALWGSLTAQAQQRLKLDSILTVIQHNNPMLQEYRYKAQALNEISKGAKSWMAPMVGLGTFMTPYPGQMVMDERDKGSVMLSAEQSIPNPAKLRANQQLLSSKAAIEEATGSYTFNELRSQAKTAFYEWLVLEKKLAILRENQEIIQLMFNIAASFSWLEPGRPYLAGITIAVLGFAWYKKLFPTTESPDCACETEGKKVSFWHTKTFLMLITVFALSTLAFPYYAHIFYPHSEKQVIVANENDFRSVEFKINGMTCQGCAEHVMFEVNKLAGIIKTNASFENGNALVEFDESKVSQGSIESAINSTGYKVVDVVRLR